MQKNHVSAWLKIILAVCTGLTPLLALIALSNLGADDDNAVSAPVPSRADEPMSTTYDPLLIDYDLADHEVKRAFDDVVRSAAMKSANDGESGRQAATSGSDDEDDAKDDRLLQRIAALREKAEHNLNSIVRLERNLSGNKEQHGARPLPTVPAGGPADAAVRQDTRLIELRQQLARSHAIHEAMRAELSHAKSRIQVLERDNAAQKVALSSVPTCAAFTPAAQAPAVNKDALRRQLERSQARFWDMDDARTRLAHAYEHCRYRLAESARAAPLQVREAAHSQISALKATREDLEQQLTEAHEVAGSCVARLEDTDARLAAMMAQVQQLEKAMADPASR